MSSQFLPFRVGRGESLMGAYSEGGDLVVEGTPNALRSLARTIREAPGSLALIPPIGREAAPYDGFLDLVLTRPGGGKVVIGREGATLTITGDAAWRSILADNLESLPARAPTDGDHLHVEYHPDHFYLAPSSASLVVELRRPDDA